MVLSRDWTDQTHIWKGSFRLLGLRTESRKGEGRSRSPVRRLAIWQEETVAQTQVTLGKWRWWGGVCFWIYFAVWDNRFDNRLNARCKERRVTMTPKILSFSNCQGGVAIYSDYNGRRGKLVKWILLGIVSPVLLDTSGAQERGLGLKILLGKLLAYRWFLKPWEWMRASKEWAEKTWRGAVGGGSNMVRNSQKRRLSRNSQCRRRPWCLRSRLFEKLQSKHLSFFKL